MLLHSLRRPLTCTNTIPCRAFQTLALQTQLHSDPGLPQGRLCPLHYRYGTAAIRNSAVSPRVVEHDLHVVGGMYGNPLALDTILDVSSREASRVVFNGDFNFFNASPDLVQRVNRTIRGDPRCEAIVGNVEYELAHSLLEDGDAGCGCAYPAYVGDETVERSNTIMQQLKTSLAQSSDRQDIHAWLKSLAMFEVFRVGELKVAVIHGDPNSLAGWEFAVENLEPVDTDLVQHIMTREHAAQHQVTTEVRLQQLFTQCDVDVFLCTHTCLPFIQDVFIESEEKHGLIVNNGSAGMPNFSNTTTGLMTKVTLAGDPPANSVAGCTLRGVHFDLVPVEYDHERWDVEFRSMWPSGSPAHTSYYQRITHGVSFYTAQQANRLRSNRHA